MRLNTLNPGARIIPKKRVGRGIGSGIGKTCGRGHKGQHSRSGASLQSGFEGGQMPLYRRIPKFGFKSRISSLITEVRLAQLNKLAGDVIDIAALKKANIIGSKMQRVKIILSGVLKKAIHVKGLQVTNGARKAIEEVGGKVEE